MSTIGERVKLIRKEHNLTQKEFGKRVNTSHAHISGIESGSVPVSERLTKLICMEFGINEAWLLTGEGTIERDFSINKMLDGIRDSRIEELLNAIDQLQPMKKEESLKCLRDFNRFINYVYSDKGFSEYIIKPHVMIGELSTIYGIIASINLISSAFDSLLIEENKKMIKAHRDLFVNNLDRIIDIHVFGKKDNK